jgi:hypothetical protein
MTSGLQGWHPTKAGGRVARKIDVLDRTLERERIFIGDVMRKHVVTSGGLARLEIYDWGVRVRGMPLSKWLVSTWEASFDEIALAGLVTTPHSRIAVWLRLRQGLGDGDAFLSTWHDDILELLDKHGVPVNRVVSTIGNRAELYRGNRRG